jgi:hypothetical protein
MPSDSSPFSGSVQDFATNNERDNGFGRKDTSIDIFGRKTAPETW